MPRDHSEDGPTSDREEAPYFTTDPIGGSRRRSPIAGGAEEAGLPDGPIEGDMAVNDGPLPMKNLR